MIRVPAFYLVTIRDGKWECEFAADLNAGAYSGFIPVAQLPPVHRQQIERDARKRGDYPPEVVAFIIPASSPHIVQATPAFDKSGGQHV